MAGPGTAMADIAEVAYRDGDLPLALDELAVRCDLIGAGPLLDQWAAKRVKRQRHRRRWATGRRRV